MRTVASGASHVPVAESMPSAATQIYAGAAIVDVDEVASAKRPARMRGHPLRMMPTFA
jgi:hypothetical protein